MQPVGSASKVKLVRYNQETTQVPEFHSSWCHPYISFEECFRKKI